MELQDYLVILRKWWWLILIGVLLGTATGFAASRFETEIYEAKTTLMIGNFVQSADPNPSHLATIQQLAKSYAEIIKREPILRATTEVLGLDMNWSHLKNKVTADLVPNTQLFEVRVTDPDPFLAKALVDEIVHQLILQSPSTFDPQEASQHDFVNAEIAEIQNNIAEVRQQIQNKQTLIDLEVTTEGLRQQQEELAFLNSRLENLQRTYASLLEFTQEKQVNNLTVIESAIVPDAPINSGSVAESILLGSLFGLALTAGIAFLIEYLDNSIKTPNDIKKTLNLATLSVVPRIRSSELASQQIIVDQGLFTPQAEAFRILRTNIRHVKSKTPLKTLLITSSTNSEGKSMVAANLAVAMAQANAKIVLINADLRRPTLHKIFKISNRAGVSSLLLDQGPNLESILARRKSSNLWVLPGGPVPPNPAELLSLPQMKNLIDRLSQAVDYVILDAPPLLPVADASILASQVDATLLVVAAGSVDGDICQRSLEILSQVEVAPLGVVLNKFNPRDSAKGYYYPTYYSSKPANISLNGTIKNWNASTQTNGIEQTLRQKLKQL